MHDSVFSFPFKTEKTEKAAECFIGNIASGGIQQFIDHAIKGLFDKHSSCEVFSDLCTFVSVLT
jgi:hypothetical protein